MKKFLAVLLSAMMLFTLGAFAGAEETAEVAETPKTEENAEVTESAAASETPEAPVIPSSADGPVEISTAEELKGMLYNLSADYVLTADVDLAGEEWTPAGIFMPASMEPEEQEIPSTGYAFTGTFDGNGHTIKGLSSSGTDGKNGLFGVNNGTIKNIHLAQGRLSGNSEMTGAVSAVNYGTIVFCSNSGVSCNASGDTNDYYVGGITGINYGLVDGCNNNAAMQADNTGSDKDIYIGGIAGSSQTNSIMADCNNAGEITAAGKHGTMAGGIAGSVNHSVIKDCGNIGSVNGTLTYDDYDGDGHKEVIALSYDGENLRFYQGNGYKTESLEETGDGEKSYASSLERRRRNGIG